MSMTALGSIKMKKCSLICMPNYKIPICFFAFFIFSMTTLLQLGVSGTLFRDRSFITSQGGRWFWRGGGGGTIFSGKKHEGVNFIW